MDALSRAIIASGEDVVKRGEGRFIIGRSLAGYKGSIRVEGGYLRCLAANALGDADRGAVVVSDGATLEFGADAEDLRFGKRAISVCGTGMNGEGALRHPVTHRLRGPPLPQHEPRRADQPVGVVPDVVALLAHRTQADACLVSFAHHLKRDLLAGLSDAVGDDLLSARLAPVEGSCCVRLDIRQRAPRER